MSKNNPKLPPLPEGGADNDRGRARREAAQQAYRQQQRKQQLRRLGLQVGIGLVVVVIAVAVTLVVLNRGSDSSTTAAGGSSTPAQVDADGGFLTGNKDAKVTVTAVEDFQCPVCKNFEALAGSLLDSYRAGDQVNVVYRGIAFLDRMSSTEYSTRALNASACVMPAGEEVWQKFHDSLYENQPPEQGDGLPDSKLISLAEDAGAPNSVASCIEDQTYQKWTKSTTDKAFADGVTGTPTIYVNGTKLDSYDPATIKTAVDAALAKK